MDDVRLTVRCPVEQESELVRQAVERDLQARSEPLTAYDRAKAAGLVGVTATGVGDLSNNRAHFDGFGEPPSR